MHSGETCAPCRRLEPQLRDYCDSMGFVLDVIKDDKAADAAAGVTLYPAIFMQEQTQYGGIWSEKIELPFKMDEIIQKVNELHPPTKNLDTITVSAKRTFKKEIKMLIVLFVLLFIVAAATAWQR